MHVQMIDLNQYENNSKSLLCYESNLATDPWIHHPNEGTSNTWQNYQKIARDKVTIFNISAEGCDREKRMFANTLSLFEWSKRFLTKKNEYDPKNPYLDKSQTSIIQN